MTTLQQKHYHPELRSHPMFWVMVRNPLTEAFQRDSGFECDRHSEAFHWARSELRWHLKRNHEAHIEVWLPKGTIRIWKEAE